MSQKRILKTLLKLRKDLPTSLEEFKKKFFQLTECELDLQVIGNVLVVKECCISIIRLRATGAISHIRCPNKTYYIMLEDVIVAYDETTGYLISYNIKA